MRFDWFKQFLINQFELVLGFSRISIRIRTPFGNLILKSYVLYVNSTHEIYFCSANFFQNFFFPDKDQDHDQDQDFSMKFIKKSYASYSKDTHQIWCRSAKFLWKSKFCSGSGSGSWFNFRFQYQTYISYIEDAHQILFASVNSFESYCVHSKDPRTYVVTYSLSLSLSFSLSFNIMRSDPYVRNIDLRQLPVISEDGIAILYVDEARNLGVMLTSNLSWGSHVRHISHKVHFSIHKINFHRNVLSCDLRALLISSLIFNILDYCCWYTTDSQTSSTWYSSDL